MAFTIRTSKPGAGNKFYITKSNGGYSACIQGKPTDSQCNVLANCVGYACGRFNEIIGSMKYPYLNCNAENFIERAQNTYGLQVVSYPTLGGIMVWQKGATLSGNDGAGHVAIVERIDGANQIYTSESAYSGSAFWNSIRTNSNGRWGMGSGYIFRGCIINPSIGDVHYVEPTPTPTPTPATLKYNIGDKVIFTGILYADSYGGGAGQSKTDLVATITAKNDGGSKPYNINNGLGWVAESDLKPYSEPTPTPIPTSEFNIGDKVIIRKTGNGNSYGTSNIAYGIGWTRYITDIHKDRAYPYQVGNQGRTDGANTTGFYKADALEKV